MMEQKELNEYIKHYIEEDKTNSAIMITAPWGAGKSYYIKNTLIPYLSDNGGHKCVVVSLYGTNSLFEVSKALYMEIRFSFLSPNSEKMTSRKFLAKTVFKGVTSRLGIDLSQSESDLEELFKSVDLSNKLVIIEDLERSGVDILEILGYVNSLVEQDNVKVLLVANEEEIVKYKPVDVNNEEDRALSELIRGKVYSDETRVYLKTKEKTISDTIHYQSNLSESIKDIIKKYKNDYFECILGNNKVDEIERICSEYNISNLRTIIFAIQKTVEIYQQIGFYDPKKEDFYKTILISNILFSDSIKCGKNVRWEGGVHLSTKLSSKEYPLFRFCYDYITLHIFDSKNLKQAEEELNLYRLYSKEKSNGDADLQILYSWYIRPEKDVVSAIHNISLRLKREDDISFYEYGKIGKYLIVINRKLGLNLDLEPTKKMLIKNLENKYDIPFSDFIFLTSTIQIEDAEIEKEYNELETRMKETIFENTDSFFGFDYLPENICTLHKKTSENIRCIYEGKSFASRLDNEKIYAMLKKCTAEQIQDFRNIYIAVYRSTMPVNNFLPNERDSLNKLLEKLKLLSSFEEYDRIQKIQIGFFIENLHGILKD